MASFWQKLVERFHSPKPKRHPLLWGILAFVLFLILFFFSALGGLRVFLPYYGELTGFPFGSRDYLVVFQNNNILTPSGGDIDTAGIAHFQSGFLTKFEAMPFGYESFNADYSKAAQDMMEVTQHDQPKLRLDGVIAMNYSFLKDLLGVLGPVESGGKSLDQASLFKALNGYNASGVSNKNLEAFADAFVHKITFSPLKLRKVTDTVVHDLSTKDLQFYFKNPALNKVLMDQGWSSAWPQIVQGDFLAVTETNENMIPSDRYLQRHVNYHLLLKKNPASQQLELTADVLVNLSYYGNENLGENNNYQGFFRLAVPAGSTLIDVPKPYQVGIMESKDGLLYIPSNLIELKPGQSTQLYFRYQLPNSVLTNGSYRLFIPKQSGTSEDYYTVIFEAPTGTNVSSDSFTAKENFGVYQSELTTDLLLSLKIIPPI